MQNFIDTRHAKQQTKAKIEHQLAQYVSKNEKQAIDIALGRKDAPEGYFKADIYEAVESKALIDKNIDILNELARSGVPTQAGQELVGFKGDENTFVKRVKKINKLLKEKKTGTNKNDIITETKKKNLSKAELETKLSNFIDKITC